MRVLALGAVLGVAATACSTSFDTTQLADDDVERGASAPTTSIVRSELPTTTTTASTTSTSVVAAPAGTAPADVTETLGRLVNAIAADPAIAQLLAGGLELPDLAALVGIQLPDLEQLQLSAPDLEQLAASVLAQPPAVAADLAGGLPDEATLLAVLGSSLDLEEFAGGATGSLVSALVASIGNLQVNPQLTVQLDELLDGFEALNGGQQGPIAANPGNVAFFTLLLSAFIGENPLLTEQLLANDLLEPELKGLLQQLQSLNASLSDAANRALLQALRQLFPDLIPPA